MSKDDKYLLMEAIRLLKAITTYRCWNTSNIYICDKMDVEELLSLYKEKYGKLPTMFDVADLGA